MGRNDAILESADWSGPGDHRRLSRTLAIGALLIVLAAAGFAAWHYARSRGATPQGVETAREFRRAGDRRTAVIVLKQRLLEAPDDVDARILLARLYNEFERGDLDARTLEPLRGNRGFPNRAMPVWLEAELLLGKPEEVLQRIDTHTLRTGSDTASRLLLGRAQLEAGRFEASEQTFDQILSRSPSNAGALAGLARIGLRRRRFGDAERWAARAIEKAPGALSGWLVKGDILYALGRFQEARQAYAHAVELNGDIARARLGLARTLLVMHRYPGADAQLAAVESVHRGLAEVLLLKALSALGQGALTQAAADAAQLAAAFPASPRAMLVKGTVALRQSRYAEATASLELAVAKAPGSIHARELLARAQLATGGARDAIRTLVPAQRADPFNREVLTLLGQAYLASGNAARANALLARAMKTVSGPQAARMRTGLALQMLALGDVEGARAERAKARVENPGGNEGAMLDAFLALQAGRTSEATELAGQLARGTAGKPAAIALNLQGIAFETAGDLERARATYEAARKQAPDYLYSTFNLARLEARAGRTARARALYRDLSAEGANPEASIALANLAYEAGDAGAARQELEAARGKHPDHIGLRLALVRLDLDQGRAEAARALAEDTLGLAPHNPNVVRLTVASRERTGAATDGLALLEQAVREAPGNAMLTGLVTARRYARGERKEARRALAAYVTAGRRQPAALAEAARMALSGQDGEEAARLVSRALKAAPGDPVPILLAADIDVAAGRYHDAVRRYRSLLDRDPDGAARLKLGHALWLSGDRSGAERQFRLLLARDAGDFRARLSLAQLYAREGKPQAARLEYERVLERRPRDRAALNNLAALLLRKGDSKEALVVAARAYALPGFNAHVADTYGWALHQTGKVQKAVEVLALAVQAAPARALPRYHLGAARARAGDRKGAIGALAGALRLGLEGKEARHARLLLARLEPGA